MIRSTSRTQPGRDLDQVHAGFTARRSFAGVRLQEQRAAPPERVLGQAFGPPPLDAASILALLSLLSLLARQRLPLLANSLEESVL